MKHTKGEWKYNISKKNEIQVIIPNGKILQLGFIYSDDCGLPSCCRVEEHANAKLIAAAPELLEALNSLIYENDGTYFVGIKGDSQVPEIVYNAIKKATE